MNLDELGIRQSVTLVEVGMQAEGGVVEVEYNSATLATVSGFDKNSSSDAKATSDLLVRMNCPINSQTLLNQPSGSL